MSQGCSGCGTFLKGGLCEQCVAARLAAFEGLVEAIKDAEWIYANLYSAQLTNHCPSCANSKREGHHPDCKFKKALTAAIADKGTVPKGDDDES